MNTITFWCILVIIFGVFEALTIQLVSIWFMFGALAAFIAACCNISLGLQLIIFAVVSVILLLLTRPVIKKFFPTGIEPTNFDSCIHRTGIVTETINNLQNKGQVKIGGQIWSAKSLNNEVIPVNTEVIVEKIEGVKAVVVRKKINN